MEVYLCLGAILIPYLFLIHNEVERDAEVVRNAYGLGVALNAEHRRKLTRRYGHGCRLDGVVHAIYRAAACRDDLHTHIAVVVCGACCCDGYLEPLLAIQDAEVVALCRKHDVVWAVVCRTLCLATHQCGE